MATTNSPTITQDLAGRAAHAVMQASLEAGRLDQDWLQRFEQLDERKPGDCINLAMEAPNDFLRGYLLAKASAAATLPSC